MSAECPACTSGVRGVHHSTDCENLAPTFVCVSVFERPDGRRVVHAYGGEQGFYPTRSKAQASRRRTVREIVRRADDEMASSSDEEARKALDEQKLTLHVCEVIPL